ncbi:MAG TPA: type II secretion system secretin GspD [Nevskiaceae bacterium]|nr:type II secretion system secretin GspD [Nevskiaceae bacterium]
MIRFRGILVAAALSAAALLPSTALWAQVTLNLKDADISTLIATVSEVTGRNFIVDSRVKGKVTVISSSPMDADSVYETFLAVLQVNGFAAIPSGDTIKIVPETNARQDGGTLSSSGAGLAIDEVVTHVYQIQNVSAAQLVPILRPMVPQWGHLAAYAPSNVLIISDRAANVQRLERLIRQIDLSGDREIEMVKLEHAAASEVVRIVTTLTQQDKQADATSKPAVVIADERSNSVLIGGDKAEREKLLEIVTRLDIPVGGDGATQVIYLRYASAENLAPILEGYAQQVAQTEQRGGAAPAGGAAPVAAAGGGGAGGTRVIADVDTNALIVTAAPKTMRQIRDVIAQLDIQRAQVLVEAIIAEVSADKSSQLGVDWVLFNEGQVAAAGILDPSTLTALQGLARLDADDEVPATAAAGLLGQGINVIGGGDRRGTTFGVLLKALKGDGDTNVLSTPTLTTLDNEEAEISVGQEVPFLSGSFSNTGTGSGVNGAVNPFQTIERKDVGLTLGITPQINEGSNIKLKIDLEVSSLSSGAAGAVDLVTNKRTITNTVSVDDGQILVLGGLMDDQLQDTQRGVPFLSSIPLLGTLFKYRAVSKQRRNLMVFIRPAILRKPADGDYYSRRKYDALREAQIGAVGGAIPLVGGNRPVLRDYLEYLADRPAADPAPATTALPGGEAGKVYDPAPVPAPAPAPASPPPLPYAEDPARRFEAPATGGSP